MTTPILPDLDGILTRGLDTLHAVRPRSGPHTDDRSGRYWHPFAGWRAQSAVVAGRLTEEVSAARLRVATGAALRELAQGEFVQEPLPDVPTKARGTVTLTRTGALGYGVLREGTILKRPADPSGIPIPLASAEYAIMRPVVVAAGQSTVDVDVEATKPGPDANVVRWRGSFSDSHITSKGLFDPLFTVAAGEVAGGSRGFDDVTLRRIAKASATGQFGPTSSALVALALRTSGARNIAIIDAADIGASVVYAADESWGSSAVLSNAVVQRLYDEVQGFGCKIVPGLVRNIECRLNLNVTLRSARFLNDTADISAAIRKSARAYFDERPDWFTWKNVALRAVVTGASSKILKCTFAELRDAYLTRIGFDFIPIPDGAAVPNVYTSYLYHYYLAENTVNITFGAPS